MRAHRAHIPATARRSIHRPAQPTGERRRPGGSRPSRACAREGIKACPWAPAQPLRHGHSQAREGERVDPGPLGRRAERVRESLVREVRANPSANQTFAHPASHRARPHPCTVPDRFRGVGQALIASRAAQTAGAARPKADKMSAAKSHGDGPGTLSPEHAGIYPAGRTMKCQRGPLVTDSCG
jgi:hypothetical protein